jgi:hypothetical protein
MEESEMTVFDVTIFLRLKFDAREEYMDKARKILYPDLRPTFDGDIEIMQAIAVLLFKADRLQGRA